VGDARHRASSLDRICSSFLFSTRFHQHSRPVEPDNHPPSLQIEDRTSGDAVYRWRCQVYTVDSSLQRRVDRSHPSSRDDTFNREVNSLIRQADDAWHPAQKPSRNLIMNARKGLKDLVGRIPCDCTIAVKNMVNMRGVACKPTQAE
jgi:hypothetical protein